MKKIIFLLLTATLFTSSCTKANDTASHSEESSSLSEESAPATSESSAVSESNESSTLPISYEQITQEEAKRLMDTEIGYAIVDARTEEEFAEGHIKNAILIPEYEISEKASQLLPDKSQLILVYCRSGRISEYA